MDDNVIINIVEEITEVTINTVSTNDVVQIAVTENNDVVEIDITQEINDVAINVSQEINEVTINVSQYDAQQIDVIKLDLQLTNTLKRYVVFEYDIDGNLENKSIYKDDTMVLKYYNIDYAYSSGDLTTITVTRISDSFSYIKEFDYDLDGNLTTININ